MASITEEKCMGINALYGGGKGTRFNFASVINSRVPSDPASNLQRLKSEYGNSNRAIYVSLDDYYFTKFQYPFNGSCTPKHPPAPIY